MDSYGDLLGGTVDTALTFGTGSYDFDRTAETVPTNALQSMAPITGNDPTNNNWSGFWQDTLKGLVGAGVRQYSTTGAIDNNTKQTAAAQLAAQQKQSMQSRQLLLFAGVGLAVFLVARR